MTTSAATPSARTLAEVALTAEEYALAVELLGRAPNSVELGIIGALWSEHCGYKTSRPLLAGLPTDGPRVLQGPGENAGAIDLGEGRIVVFKIESHNHPSAIEPYEGAATGVGGILRDIFTMGARPVALLDSLRFGPLDEPHQRHLLDGVVGGIGGYGNCIGVPTVGGEVVFDESYRHNCLVNAMCVGVADRSSLTRAVAAGPGNPVLLVGADTGRDGIHGATFASVAMDEASSERRPAVQVGNPFLEKCLMEACLEIAGDPRVVAMQDLGAAGLTSSTAELARKGGCGIQVDVACVARRESGMTPYEVMLSESQERMLVVVRAGEERAVQDRFSRWDLHSDVIGHVTGTGRLVVREGTKPVCDLPLELLIDRVPLRRPAPRRPAALDAIISHDPLAEVPPWEPGEALLRLLGSPNLGSRRPIWQRYDHQVGDDTVIGPGGDAALLRIRGTGLAIALATDGNARYGALDPRRGAEIAVAEAARNVSATGAEPVAVTDCLNFGNPERPEVFWQLAEAISGLGNACRALGTPIVSGNVSLYNDTSGASIDPTPVVGMVGRLADVERRCEAGLRADGDRLALAGPLHPSDGPELGGSEYQRLAHRANAGSPPALDLDLEWRVQSAVREAIAERLLASAHDCAEGGMAVAFAESCLAGGRGGRVRVPTGDGTRSRPSWIPGILFGESQSRFIISYGVDSADRVAALMIRHRVPLLELGSVGGESISIEDLLEVPLESARRAHDVALHEPG